MDYHIQNWGKVILKVGLARNRLLAGGLKLFNPAQCLHFWQKCDGKKLENRKSWLMLHNSGYCMKGHRKMKISRRLFGISLVLAFISGILLLPSLVLAAEYKYDKSPVFIAEYDDEMKSSPPDEKSAKGGMVFFAMKAGWVEGFMVNVRSAEGVTLDTVSKKHLAEMKADTANSDVELISSEKTETMDGTPAVKTVIEYVASSGAEVTRLFFDTIKDNKWVFIDMWTIMDPEDIMDYLTSLEFE